MSPLFIAGAAVFTFGFVMFLAVLFANGGVAKSAQFRVIGELARGQHGGGPRFVFFASLPLTAVGACLLFGAVGASDHERAERCEARCESEGYASARIGPNTDRDPSDRSTVWVACICEDPARETLELRANDL